jgi:hypothetical protein
MITRPHEMKREHHRHKHLRCQTRDRMILAGFAALIAFIGVYASVGNAKIIFAFASALGAGAIIYLVASSGLSHKG